MQVKNLFPIKAIKNILKFHKLTELFCTFNVIHLQKHTHIHI